MNRRVTIPPLYRWPTRQFAWAIPPGRNPLRGANECLFVVPSRGETWRKRWA